MEGRRDGKLGNDGGGRVTAIVQLTEDGGLRQ